MFSPYIKPSLVRIFPPLVIALFAFIQVGWFMDSRGNPNETIFIELSQQRPGLLGFIYPFDMSRVLLSLSYHLAFLISDGGYISLHIVNTTLLWLTGLLVFLVVQSLPGFSPRVAIIASIFVVVHGADRAIAFMPLLQVRQGIVGALLAVYSYIRLCETGQKRWAVLLVVGQALALWTYEALLPIILVSGYVIVKWKRGSWHKIIIWYLVPGLNILHLVFRYAVETQPSYQLSRVVMPDISEIATRLVLVVYESVNFFSWPAVWLENRVAGCFWEIMHLIAMPLLWSLAAAVVLAVYSFKGEVVGRSSCRPGLALALVLLLIVTYAPFLFVNNLFNGNNNNYSIGTWRAHFFGAIPSSIILSGFVRFLYLRFGRVIAASLTVLVILAGSFCGLVSQLEGQAIWGQSKMILRAIIDQAPHLKDDSFVALLDVPSGRLRSICHDGGSFDPYIDTMWFNSALKVLYPGARLVGLYWTQDYQVQSSIQFLAVGDHLSLTHSPVSVDATYFSIDKVVAFRFDSKKGAVLLPVLSPNEIPGLTETAQYFPASRIDAHYPAHPATISKLR